MHTNLSESRPSFRMEAFESYFAAMKGPAERSGLRAKKFEKMSAWVKACAKELKIKDVKTAFVPAKDAAAFDAQKEAVKRWIDQSRPVLLVRENTFMPGVTHEIFPLDVALIDGYDESGARTSRFRSGATAGRRRKAASTRPTRSTSPSPTRCFSSTGQRPSMRRSSWEVPSGDGR